MNLKKLIPCALIFGVIFVFVPGIPAQKKKTPPKKVVVVPPRDPNRYTMAGSSPPSAAGVRTPEQQRRFDAFLKVWQTINDNYFDPTFGGLDWTAVRSEFAPRVENAKTDDELYQLLEEMIGRLNKSHFAIIPPEVYRAIEYAKTTARQREKERIARKGKADPDDDGEGEDKDVDEIDVNARYGIGVEMRLMNDQFCITRVIEGSAAEKAGLKAGYIIDKINDVSLKELLKKIEGRYSRTRNIRKLMAGEIVTWMLNGAMGTDVGLTYLNEKDEPKDIRIPREMLSGAAVSIGKDYPEQYLNFESRSINDEVGYVKFNLFAMPIIEKFCSSLTNFKNKKALIVDLRGNYGGLFAALIGISGMMSDHDIDLGTQIYRSGTEKLKAASQAKNFKGKMVILVDDLSISSAEVLASAMQEGGRALIVGERTAGEALPAISAELPTGAVLMYPIANLKTAKGKLIEGLGITPDIAVNIDRRSLLDGHDLQMEAALKAIKDNTPVPSTASAPRSEIAGAAGDDLPPPPTPKRTPPPPVPSGEGSGRGSGTGNGNGPPPPMKYPPAAAAPPVSFSKDEKSREVIAEFLKTIGGEEAIRGIESYSIKGVTAMKTRGADLDAGIEIYRQKTDKYAEISSTNAIGQLREIYTKEEFLMQTDFGIVTTLPVRVPIESREVLSPILRLTDKNAFKSLSYSGIFDRDGRKAHVINAIGADGEGVALAFDVETKLLVGYASSYLTYSLGDYTKVKDLLLPFSIDRGRTTILIYDIKVNSPIDESNFQRKVNCFDTPN